MRAWLIVLTLYLPHAASAREVQAPLTWVVKTSLVGEMNSMRAVARKLGGRIVEVDLPPALATADAGLETGGEFEVDQARLRDEVSRLITDVGAPDLVFNSLTRLARLEFVREIKAQQPAAHAVNFQDPMHHREIFDTILYNPFLDTKLGVNTVPLSGVPTLITTVELDRYRTPSVTDGEGPHVAVLVGGKAKASDLNERHFNTLAMMLNDLHARTGAKFVITNSRRTSAAAFSVLLNGLKAPFRSYDWSQGSDDQSLYFAILTQSEYVIVTGDSMSMLSDSVSSGKPTYVFAPPGSLEDRHRRFILELAKRGGVRPLGGDLETWSYPPIDAAAEAANTLRTRCAAYLGGS